MKDILELASRAAPPTAQRSGVLWIKDLDRLLRGEGTDQDALADGTLSAASDRFQVAIVLLGICYGACMGVYALLRGESASVLQFIAGMVKVPALFLLTLLVTFPSLYVFNALIGSRLGVGALWRLLTASVALNMAVLASLGPVVAFFSLSTSSYSFMLLLNVAVFGVAGILGLRFLFRSLQRLTLAQALSKVAPPVLNNEGTSAEKQTSDSAPARQVRAVFGCWMVAFALVGAQMGWVLRPFLGNPSTPFSFFRGRESNFFEAIWQHLAHLLS